MNRRRAYEEVEISFGGNAVTLRPTLRAATIIEERFGFPVLKRALDEFNLTIISEIILACATGRQNAAAFLFGIEGRPLSPFASAVRQPLADLVSMFIPAPDPHAKPSAGKPQPWRDLYADLYATATGFLGWTPETAWNATPTEITRAFQAHIEKLKAIHGDGTEEKQRGAKVDTEALSELLTSDDLDPEFDRAGLHALQGRRRKA